MTGASDDATLTAMLAAVERAPALYRPSRYWQRLNRDHLASLASPEGFAHFKRTLNESYFQFGLYAFPRALLTIVGRWMTHHDVRALTARFERPTRARFAPLLAPATALFAEAVATLRGGDSLWDLEEPAVGDPMVVRWGRRRTTQDICHSVEEYLAMRNALADRRLARVGELGAGYGRVAWTWLHLDRSTQYYVIDIPPALYVSQRYLGEVLPDVPTFRFRPFASYGEVAAEISAARLVFLMPHQLELLPDRHLDLMLTISTLHEMRHEQIVNYLRLVDAKCASAFYLKQWRSWRNPVDGIEVARGDYVMPSGWTIVFDRKPLLPREFFEALYVRTVA